MVSFIGVRIFQEKAEGNKSAYNISLKDS